MKIVKNDKDAVIDENILDLDRQQRALFEKRLAHNRERLRFSGRIIYDEEETGSEEDASLTFDRYLSSKKTRVPSEDVAEINGEELSHLFRSLDRFDRFFLIKLLSEKYPHKVLVPAQTDDAAEGETDMPASVSYVKSRGADDAYAAFSKELPALSAAYADDFSAACEAVYYRKSRYCLLPLENSADGRLIGFYNLIGRYELKIVSTCDVTDPDGAIRSRFALCARDFDRIADSDTLDYELYFPGRNGDGLSEILMAAEYYRLAVRRIDSIPASADAEPDKNQVYLTMQGKAADMETLLYYLETEYADYTVIGAYRPLTAI